MNAVENDASDIYMRGRASSMPMLNHTPGRPSATRQGLAVCPPQPLAYFSLVLVAGHKLSSTVYPVLL